MTKEINHKRNFINVLLIGLTTFILYTFMYAIRRPFTALVYDNMSLWGANIKIWMVLAQLLGYTLSKFFGIQLLGKIQNKDRGIYLISILAIATLPLFLLQYTTIKYWPFLMLLNGFPLGLVWGIVYSYVEGRKYTELIGAMLACTFVFSTGWVKSFGLYLQQYLSLTIEQVPFYTGAAALIASALVILMLEKLPPPNSQDKQLRNDRKPLTPERQKLFLAQYGQIMLPFVLIYAIFTIMRDLRDNFSAEMLAENDAYNNAIFTSMELKVSIVLLCIVPLFSWIKNHRQALNITVFSILLSAPISLVATILFAQAQISIVWLLMLTGGGFYLGYILINISVMDRLIGFSGESGNAGFLIYIADSVGYLFSLVINSFALLNKLESTKWTSTYLSVITIGTILVFLLALSIPYQLKKKKQLQNEEAITT